MGLLAGSALFVSAVVLVAEDVENDRTRVLKEKILAARDILNYVTNDTETAEWNKRIIEEFEKAEGIEFAYSTQRLIPAPEEGALPVSIRDRS